MVECPDHPDNDLVFRGRYGTCPVDDRLYADVGGGRMAEIIPPAGAGAMVRPAGGRGRAAAQGQGVAIIPQGRGLAVRPVRGGRVVQGGPAGADGAGDEADAGSAGAKEPWNPKLSIWNSAETKILGRAVELMIIFALASIIVFYFPFWEKIGYALVFYGFYTVFPDKYDLYFRATKILDAREKRMGRSLPENAAAELVQDQVKTQMGWIWAKLFLKLMITFLVGVQFISVHPLIALIVFLYTYFSLASGYSEDEPDKAVEGWYRFFLGIFIATFFWAVFSGQAGMFENSFQIFFTMFTLGIYPLVVYIFPDYALWLAGQPPAPATLLFFLALAYFATFPAQMERK